jgi:hypothetical protein
MKFSFFGCKEILVEIKRFLTIEAKGIVEPAQRPVKEGLHL